MWNCLIIIYFEDCWNTSSGVAEHHRFRLLGHRFWGRCTVIIADRWGIVSHGVAHRGIAGVSPPDPQNNYRGIARETSFRIGPQNIFGIAGGERHRESLRHHRSFRAAEPSFWGHWTSLSRFGLRRNITSGVGEHRRSRLGENCFWGRCTINIWITRRTYASSGVAPAFRQHLFCSSTTRNLCTWGRLKRGRLLRSLLLFNKLIVGILFILEMQLWAFCSSTSCLSPS